MVSSNPTEVTIDFFPLTLWKQNPKVILNEFMSDQDHGQMNVVQRQYSESILYLCWWHVLHAWQQHFVTTQFPKLWELLKKWISVTDDDEFEAYWMKIRALAPSLAPPAFWITSPYTGSHTRQCVWLFITRITLSSSFVTLICLSKHKHVPFHSTYVLC